MKTTDKPVYQEFHIEGVKHISPKDAMEAVSNNEAVLIDVREPDEIALENVPLDNVLNHPMSVIMDRLPFISRDQNIILACPGGVRSTKVANLLNREGYPSVANLDGGLNQWNKQGFPYDQSQKFSGLTYAGGGGCGCGCGTSSADNGKGSCC